ncbi:hypothetical protein LWI28_015553 [Acer negundo]|uniref:NAC domain-containing protein n=1 Tax=Acer negundo TaxID=4023 RepID=A0AAD5IZK8_ACENE|nr:hypothetical protein LWI28_015553 [Acer negundo]
MEDEEQRNQLEDDMTGYRFHPTEEEIVSYFLEHKLRGRDYRVRSIHEVDINKFEPWVLPRFSAIETDDPVWYFFTKLDYMDTKRIRVNRKTEAGYWKITGKDRPVKNKYGTEIGSKKTLVFHRGRFPNGVGTHWVIQEFHYKDANKRCQRPFVLCRLKRKSNGIDEPSPPQLPSNSGNCHNVNIVQQENNELRLELQPGPLFNDDELSALQFLIDRAQGPSCSNDSSRSQLNIREQEDDFIDSMWASGEDQQLHEENVQTRLHGFEPAKSLSGYIADSSKAQSGTIHDGSIVLQAFGHQYKPEKPRAKPKEMPLITYIASSGNFRPVQLSDSRCYGPVVRHQSDSSDSTIETTHEQGKVMKTPRIVAQCHGLSGGRSKQQLQMCYDESYKKPWEKPKAAEKPKMAVSRKGSYIYLETPAWSHKQYPPSVYIKNIVVALYLLVFFVAEMVSLH